MVFSVFLVGCTLQPVMKLDMPAYAGGEDVIKDKRKPSVAPAYFAGEGNVYSCNYGVGHIEEEKISPPIMSMLKKHLIDNYPDISAYNIEITYLDVFYNYRGNAVRVTSSDPSSPQGSKKVVIGCEEALLGGYNIGEVPTGATALVFYLSFNVNGKNIDIRYVEAVEENLRIYRDKLQPWMEQGVKNLFSQVDIELKRSGRI
jgi:hypothetical protein